ncbi:FAD-binding oxidoreductase [Saccharothrix syringae]|uniref:FAD-binding oxidoreductase n=1 Tax=Saccharothrix syringae TaxID=103733 RepID=A0A5Q0H6U4_SACSY|nr:FAD-binding protein [Saccharothrix syringae]QFZ21683.1 FAD-binding oxidoreductase [Saccharothrix syringae]
MTTSTAPVAAELRGRVAGDVLVAGDAGYDSARRVWNGAVDRSPAVVVRAAGEGDVVHAVRAARERGLPLSVRGGGHDWAGRAVRDGGLVVDLTRLREVTADRYASTLGAQGGATAGGVAAVADRHGLAAVLGTVKAVGAAGLTLGGGYGLLLGKHGLALDNLVDARVVLADGRVAVAGEDEDLLWALRGGGGNFGVVTRATYRAHPLRAMTSGMVLFDLPQARSVLRGYRELTAAAPDELTVMTGFFAGPDGRALLYLLPAWSGNPSRGEQWARRLTSLGRPVSARVGQMSPLEVLGLLDAVVVDGRHTVAANRQLPEVGEEAAEVLVDAAARIPSPHSGVFVHHFHGAAARVPVASTAFALRRPHNLVEVVGTWEAGEDGAAHRAWVERLSADLAPLSLAGGYQNLLAPEETERVRVAYGANASRLFALKRRYDPENAFSAVPTLF